MTSPTAIGVSTAITDGAIWIEARHHSQWNASVLVAEAKGDEAKPGHAELAKHFFVYTHADLEDIHTEMLVVWRLLFDFLTVFRDPTRKSATKHATDCSLFVLCKRN